MKTRIFSVLSLLCFGLVLQAQIFSPSNKILTLPGRPDLIVEKLEMAAYLGQPGQPLPTIKVTIKNIGTALATGSKPGVQGYMVDLILSMDAAAPVQYAVVPNPYVYNEDMLLIGGRVSNTIDLAPGQSQTYVLNNLPLPKEMSNPCGLGYSVLGAVVDPGLKIAESNESNNLGFTRFKLDCGQKRPDLVIQSIKLDPQYGQPGLPLNKIYVTVANIGGDQALGTDVSGNGYMVDVILSMDQNAPVQYALLPNPYVYNEDMLLWGARISNTKTLAPGAVHTYELTNISLPKRMDNPCGRGFIYVGAVADPGLKIAEGNENNNLGFEPLKLVCRPGS